MKTLNIGMVQMNSAVNDKQRNLQRAAELISEACEKRADIVVLPEFFNTEYFAQYRESGYTKYAEHENGETIATLRSIANERDVFICAAIYEYDLPGVYYDTTFMINRSGVVIGKYRKTHPAAMKSLEKIYFRGGNEFPVWDVDGFKVASIICYDHCFPEAARSVALRGADVVLGPFATPKTALGNVWRSLMITRAFENALYMAPCNKVGIEGEWDFLGRSMVVDPFGKVLYEAGSAEDEVFVVPVHKEHVEDARVAQPFYRDRRPELYGSITATDEDVRCLMT